MSASPKDIAGLIVVAEAIGVLSKCERCDGDGGFEDTTYNRTGEWGYCGHCKGKGLIYAGPLSPRAEAAKNAYEAADRRRP